MVGGNRDTGEEERGRGEEEEKEVGKTDKYINARRRRKKKKEGGKSK